MRILDARLGRNGGGVGKEDSAIHNTELNDHNVTDGSTDQDALDMAKLGLTQQTKVSTATAMTTASNIANSENSVDSASSRCWASPPL